MKTAATYGSRPSSRCAKNAANIAAVKSAPWAKLMMCSTPLSTAARRMAGESMAGQLGRVPLAWMHDGAADSVRFPPPCREGLGVGVVQFCADVATSAHSWDPHPYPSPQGGGEQTEFAARTYVRFHPKTASGPRHREHRLRRRERSREYHLDVVAEHLRVDRRRPLVLAVDEPGRAIRHHMAREGRISEGGDDLRALGPCGAFDCVGQQQDAGVVHIHFVGVELAFLLDLLLERQCLRVLRVEPVIAIHDKLRSGGKFFDKLVG